MKVIAGFVGPTPGDRPLPPLDGGGVRILAASAVLRLHGIAARFVEMPPSVPPLSPPTRGCVRIPPA
jgi:hypothetical protein